MAAPPPVAPFEFAPLPGSGSGAGGVLLLHGFTGTPYEVRAVGERLAQEGFHASGILLRGHGTVPPALRGVRAEDWFADAERGLAHVRRAQAGPVFVVGLSMGALLAIRLAALHPDSIAALVLLATPLRPHGTWRRFLLPLATWPPLARRLTYRKRGGSDIQDPEARRRNPSYPEAPMTAVAEYVRVMEDARGRLPQVRCPVLVLHGRLDRTARVEDADRLESLLTGASVRKALFDRSGHVLTVDGERDRVEEEIVRFLGEQAACPSRRPLAMGAAGRGGA